MVTAFSFKFSLFSFLCMTEGTIRLTQILLCSISSASLVCRSNIFFIWLFFTLASVTTIYFLSDVFYNDGPVEMLENNRLPSIHSCMKEIRIVPIQYVTLEYYWNNNISLTHYKVKIFITYSMKRTVFVCTIFIFRHSSDVFLLIFADWFLIYKGNSFR